MNLALPIWKATIVCKYLIYKVKWGPFFRIPPILHFRFYKNEGRSLIFAAQNTSKSNHLLARRKYLVRLIHHSNVSTSSRSDHFAPRSTHLVATLVDLATPFHLSTALPWHRCCIRLYDEDWESVSLLSLHTRHVHHRSSPSIKASYAHVQYPTSRPSTLSLGTVVDILTFSKASSRARIADRILSERTSVTYFNEKPLRQRRQRRDTLIPITPRPFHTSIFFLPSGSILWFQGSDLTWES